MTKIAYEIRVSGVIPESVLEELEGIEATVQPVGTILYGPVADDAELHGILNRLQAFGLHLVEVRQLPAARSGSSRTGAPGT